jgi:hypothetical protein
MFIPTPMTFVVKVAYIRRCISKQVTDLKINLLKHKFGGEVCYHPLTGKPYYISTHTHTHTHCFFFGVVLCNLILSKSFIYQLMHNGVALKEY